MPDLDWSDLKHALAVAEAGSLAGASRQLGVNHTTVLRRLDALEATLGTRLFDRKRSGYEPTDAGQAVLAHARHMADRVDEIERQVLGRDRELTGVLRVATAFVIMEHLLPAPLADFARAYPGIEVEVTENAFLVDLSRQRPEVVGQSLAHREADVALRLSGHVAEHLVGRNLGMTQCRIYARRGAPGLPQNVQPLQALVRDAPWVAFERTSRTGSTTAGCGRGWNRPTSRSAWTSSTRPPPCCAPASVSACSPPSWRPPIPNWWPCRSRFPSWRHRSGC